jgi:hypothetical protein
MTMSPYGVDETFHAPRRECFTSVSKAFHETFQWLFVDSATSAENGLLSASA